MELLGPLRAALPCANMTRAGFRQCVSQETCKFNGKHGLTYRNLYIC